MCPGCEISLKTEEWVCVWREAERKRIGVEESFPALAICLITALFKKSDLWRWNLHTVNSPFLCTVL